MPKGVYQRPSANARFWAKVNKDGPIAPGMDTPCWVWLSPLKSNGRGQFWDGVRHVLAYGWAWEQENGPVPNGLELDHLCRVPVCVRPLHLEPVTQLENFRRRRHPAKAAELIELGSIYRLYRYLCAVEAGKLRAA